MRSRDVALAAAALAASPLVSASLAVDRTWISATGTFQTGTNWTGGAAPSTALDNAIFDSVFFQYTVTFAGSVVNNAFAITDNGTLNLAGNSYTLVANSPGAISFSQPSGLSINNTISNGTLSCPDGNLRIGDSGETHRVTISANTTLNVGLDINLGGTGTLTHLGTGTCTGSFFVGVNSVSDANAQIGGTMTVGDELSIGNLGTGSMDVSGSITAGSLTIAQSDSGSGTLTTSGAVGRVVITGPAVIGQFGGSGMINIPAGTLSTGSASIGSFAGAVGTVSIGSSTGGIGTWNAGTSLVIGDAGRGEVVVQNLSRLTQSGPLNIGSTTTGVGTLRIEGESFASLGSITIGNGGDGTVTVKSNSLVQTGPIVMANSNGSTATLTVQGINAILDAGANPMTVGVQGTARLNILDGGRIRSGNVSAAAGPAGGGFPGTGIATITVSGGGAAWDINGTLGVGSFDGTETVGTAVMSINGGGAVAVTGDATVFPGSTLNLNGGSFSAQRIVISSTGSPPQLGQFNFNSGTVSVASLSLSSSGPAFGPNFVSDPDHALRVNGTLTIPDATSVTMRGGYLSSSTISIASGGELILDDPSSFLLVGTQLFNSGTIRGDGRINSALGTLLNSSAGEIRASVGDRIEFTRAATNNGLVNLLGGEVEFGTTFTNAATGRVTGRGMLMASSIVNTGSMLFSAGLSDVYGTVANNIGGKIIVSGAGNASFYDPVTNNAGSEFRVSTNSTATFFASVVGVSLFTGTGVKIFESSAVGGPLAGSGSSIVEAAGAITTSFIRETTMTINGGSASVLPNGTDAATSRLTNLQFAGAPGAWDGQFDLSNNALVIDYAITSPILNVADQIKSGFNGGSWNGQGIGSSAAAAQANRALGFAEATDIGSPATFAGQSVDSTCMLVRFTIPGDANLDRVVDIGDFALLAANFNTSSMWSRGDFNYDASTDIGDFALLAANFNQSLPLDLPALSRGEAPRAGAVPEPFSTVWLLLCIGAMNRTRRRRIGSHRPI